MYQLMCMGQHPLYQKEEKYLDYLNKLRNIRQAKSQWEFPPHFSNLAIDFITKMCAYSATERYDTKSALKHPWITREFDAAIPLTQKQQIK